MRTLHNVVHRNGKVVATIREWEGIGTPDYYDLEYFDIAAATWASDAFNKSIQDAKEYNEKSKESRIKTLEQEIQMRQDELNKLKG
jgi:hypothetical protein